jgi:hypothetical protein
LVLPPNANACSTKQLQVRSSTWQQQ